MPTRPGVRLLRLLLTLPNGGARLLLSQRILIDTLLISLQQSPERFDRIYHPCLIAMAFLHIYLEVWAAQASPVALKSSLYPLDIGNLLHP